MRKTVPNDATAALDVAQNLLGIDGRMIPLMVNRNSV
jgi:hypothetical protein